MENIDPIEPKKIGDHNEINLEGIVEIINGDKRVVGKNKLVQNMLIWFNNITSSNFMYSVNGYFIVTNGWKMYLGTDTTTTTKYNTTVLTTPIGTSPGTAPNSTGGSTTNPSNGVFRVMFSATWNANTVSGTIGEMALYLGIRTSLEGFNWNMSTAGPVTETPKMASRLAAADGAFTPFAINTANPLTVNWTMQFSF